MLNPSATCAKGPVLATRWRRVGNSKNRRERQNVQEVVYLAQNQISPTGRDFFTAFTRLEETNLSVILSQTVDLVGDVGPRLLLGFRRDPAVKLLYRSRSQRDVKLWIYWDPLEDETNASHSLRTMYRFLFTASSRTRTSLKVNLGLDLNPALASEPRTSSSSSCHEADMAALRH